MGIYKRRGAMHSSWYALETVTRLSLGSEYSEPYSNSKCPATTAPLAAGGNALDGINHPPMIW